MVAQKEFNFGEGQIWHKADEMMHPPSSLLFIDNNNIPKFKEERGLFQK